jgi:hypothetical protein
MEIKNLYCKKIDLKKSNVFGGTSTSRDETTSTNRPDCPCGDTRHSMIDDNNVVTASCVSANICP